MKRIQWWLVLCFLLLTACGKEAADENLLPAQDVFMSYDATGAKCFTVDEDGVVYVPTPGKIITYGLDGQIVATYPLKDDADIWSICQSDGFLYLYGFFGNEMSLQRYDMANQQLNTLDLESMPTQIKSMAIHEGALYILGSWSNLKTPPSDLSPNDSIYYESSNLLLARVMLSDSTIEIIPTDAIEGFSIRPDGKVVVFSHDDDQGYYFSVLGLEDTDEETKTYFNDFSSITSFCATEHGILFGGLSKSGERGNNNICYFQWGQPNSWADVMPDVILSMMSPILYQKGYTFYLNDLYAYSNDARVERIRNSVYIQDNQPIRVVSSAALQSNMFSGGFVVKDTRLEPESFVLSVLSNDSDYDLCYLSSGQDIAKNIRDQGSFYPLNDVPGVREYLEDCFPYIQEAATDQNGDIWMLPVTIDIVALLLQKENCENANLTFWEDETIYDILDHIHQSRQLDPEQSRSLFAYRAYIQSALSDYLRDHTTLDTPAFRQLSVALKELVDDYTQNLPSGFIDVSQYTTGQYSDMLFASEAWSIRQRLDSIVNSDELIAVPELGHSRPSVATCIFMCVNPNSDNLDTTLDYISALSRYTMSLRNSGLSNDTTKYTDSNYARSFYEVYRNAEIVFQIPYEIFMQDFNAYLNDEISLEKMLQEAQRKLDVYLGE